MTMEEAWSGSEDSQRDRGIAGEFVAKLSNVPRDGIKQCHSAHMELKWSDFCSNSVEDRLHGLAVTNNEIHLRSVPTKS
jgi:hypothetical protein